jgi:hypothetical protein
MTGPRRIFVTSITAVGLLASVGATTTTCAANSSGTSAGSTGKASGSVVRCGGTLSCDVVLRRATTRKYARRLRGQTTSTVVAAATAEAACVLLTSRLTTHIICVVGGTFFARKLIDALKRADAAGDCLKVHIQAPGTNGTWKPISYGTDGGSDCAA